MKPMSPEMEKLINDLAADMKELVDGIEKSPPTTQGHYDKYASALNAIVKNERHAIICGLALVRAGANQRGVCAAVKLLYPNI